MDSEKLRVAIGLGSNLSDRHQMIAKAARIIAEEVLAEATLSSVYESAPWGVEDQPPFLNAVAVGFCSWPPPELLSYLQALEIEMGRVPSVKWGPRLIDLDILAYGSQTWESEKLTIPHPRIAERDFVLLPLVEIWEDWEHPLAGKTVKTLWEKYLETQQVSAKLFAPPPLSKASP